LSIGDSWFQYPLRSYGDIQRKLAAHYKSKILFYDDSNAGRDAKIVPTEIQPRLNRFCEHMAREENKPFDLILVSLGGNDVIGQDFPRHLKRKNSPADGTTFQWNANIPPSVSSHIKLNALSDTFDKVLKTYDGIVTMRKLHAPQAQIICHSYADVTPSDAPYQFIGVTKGPWMFKPMNDVGLTGETEQREVARWLLESFENLLRHVARGRSFVTVLKTRQELPVYRGWWDNEIHPLGKGFQHLVDNFWVPEIDRHL
jgi:hypothetical protein